MTPDSLRTAAMVSVVLFPVLQLPIIVWVYRARPSKTITQKYPRQVIRQSRLPFANQWRGSVSSEDLPALERYRTRLHIYGVLLLVATHLLSLGSFLDALADNLECLNGQVAAIAAPSRQPSTQGRVSEQGSVLSPDTKPAAPP